MGEADRYQKIGLDFEAVDRMLVEIFLQAHREAPRQIVLDLDSTDDPLHGGQEGRFFHGYYWHYCYLPWYLCGGEPRWGARLRLANIEGAAGSVEEIERLVKQLRAAGTGERGRAGARASRACARAICPKRRARKCAQNG